MPSKGGGLTVQETRFIDEAIRCGDPEKAAELAGYSTPRVAAWKLSHRPEVQAAVQAGLMARLRVEGASIGISTLIDIARDEKAPKAPRVQAARALVDLNREANASAGAGGALSDMSRAQLDEARIKAVEYLRSLDAPPVLDLAAEPAPAEEPPGLFD